VSNSKSLKILLVEDDLEDEYLLSQALDEIEENRQWSNWLAARVVQVEQLGDALDCLRGDCFDVVLLNLSLPDNPVLLDTFHQVNDCARGAPIIVLADEEDANLANLLLREGAQDVLLKAELECAPLARSLRYAMERQLGIAMRSPSHFEDDFTRTLTRPSFLSIGMHYMHFSRLTRVPLLLASIEISQLTKETLKNREARDLLLLRTAELLGSTFEPPALIGRVGQNRFALMTAGLTETTLDAMLNRAALAIEEPPGTIRYSLAEIRADASLDEMLGHDGSEFAEGAHRRTKTVMLAD
jgi:CheY-like chemotaxis protein